MGYKNVLIVLVSLKIQMHTYHNGTCLFFKNGMDSMATCNEHYTHILITVYDNNPRVLSTL